MTQYEMILRHLRKAGNKGATIRDLLRYSNCPWKRIGEMTGLSGVVLPIGRDLQFIERHERLHNGRKIRVYVLKRTK